MSETSLIDASGAPCAGAPFGALLSAQAAAAAHRPALTAEGRTLTRAALDEAANRRARWLASLGVGQDDRVVIALPNGIAWYETVFAIWKLGATPAPISHRLAPGERDAIIALCQPRLVISDLAVPGFVPPVPLGADFDASPLPPRFAARFKLSTSGGSTGQPKLILDPNPACWGPDKEGRRRKPGSTIINPAPLHHSAPFGLMLPALAQGGHVIDMGRFEAETYLSLVATHRANWAYLVPTMMGRIARLPDDVRRRFDVRSLETVLHMAAPCAVWIKQAWIDWLGPDVIWEVYGGTERIGATFIGGRDWLEHRGSVGRPAPGNEIGILAEDGAIMASGEIGEIYFREAAQPSFEYVGATPRRRDGWASFGDFGWLDPDGYLFIADRRADMVVCGGANLYPAEIEAALETCPGVLGSVVFGLPDDDLGQVVHAVIQVDPADGVPPRANTLLGWLDGKLERAKWPRGFDFVTEPIRDDAGKVRRSAWRETYARMRTLAMSSQDRSLPP